MLVKDLNDCEMRARSTFETTHNTALEWSKPKDQQNKAGHLHLPLCNFITLRCNKMFVASLVDPFLVDCIILHQHSSTYSTGKFYDVHGIQRCLWRFYVFSAKNILVVVAVMIIPSLIESSMFFFQSEPLSFIEYFSKAYDGILVVDPVFHWLVFYLQPEKCYMQKIHKRLWQGH